MEMNTTQDLVRDFDLTLQPRPAPRYKVWLPLATQQLRLRSLCQIIGFNLETDKNVEICWWYFTLHRSSMSSPLYTSEPIDSVSPRWSCFEVPTLHATGFSTANEIVLRLWKRTQANNPTTDVTIFTWGISFTGLVYMGPKLSNNLEPMLRSNSLIFHLHGGFFVPSYCLLHPPEFRRYLYMSVNNSDICDSYTVSKLTKLRNIMQSLKQRTESVQILRERIENGDSSQSQNFKQTTLSRLLQPKRLSKEKKAEILRIRRELEVAKFRTKLLEQERIRKVGELRALNQLHLSIIEENQDQGSILMEKYRELNKDIERLREWRQNHIQTRECYVQTSAQLAYRKRQLISDLTYVYPIRQEAERKFTINNVHLPDSEELDASNDIATSVALGFVAHTTQLVANFLNVPTRYPIILSGSRCKIVDQITENIPEKNRSFSLFSRSKDKLQFHYGVYLLNKNIAQLRWYCGLPTSDLRATLPNLVSLINMKPNQSLDSTKRTFSGSSLDTDNSNNGKHNIPLIPPLQKFVIDKVVKIVHRPTRTMSQLKNSRTTLGSSLDQGLDKPMQDLILGKQTKRICKSEESAIDEKTFTLPQHRLCNSSDETVYQERNQSQVHERPKASTPLPSAMIETDIEITIPTSVYNSKYDGANSRQRSSNSISSCEMALSGSQTDVVDRFKDNPNAKVINSTNVVYASLAGASTDGTLVPTVSVASSESTCLSENISIASTIENTDSESSHENSTDLMEATKGIVISKSNNVDSISTLSSSVVSLDDTVGHSCERIESRPDVASSCPESAKSFYDDGEEDVPRKNWRTESNPSLETSTQYDGLVKKPTAAVSMCRSQPNRVQEAIDDYQASTEFIASIRRSSENVFARTEALASKKTSFKVMKPRS